jgi:hypothetical protein
LGCTTHCGFDHGTREPFDPFLAEGHADPSSVDGLHVGVGCPNLMLLPIKDDCGHRAHVGPVFSDHEVVPEGSFTRLTGEEWKARLEGWNEPPRAAWTREFVR